MAQKRFHLTPEGPKPCSVDPSNPRSRGCRYEGEHYDTPAAAETAYAEKMGGTAPSSVAKIDVSDTAPHSDDELDALERYEIWIDEREIEIADHSGLAGDDWVTLAKLRRRPRLLANNCYAASSEIADNFPSGKLGKTEVISIAYEDEHSHHAVSYTNSKGVEVVVDFTAAQYDRSLPIPLVVERERWQAVIEDRVLRKHGTKIANIWLESEGAQR